MFSGSIAVPRPWGEGCGLVGGDLSAVLVWFVVPSPFGVLVSLPQPSAWFCFCRPLLGLSQKGGCFRICSPPAEPGLFCTSGGVLLLGPWCVRVALPTGGGDESSREVLMVT